MSDDRQRWSNPDSGAEAARGGSEGIGFGTILLIVVVIITAGFILLNRDRANVDFLFFEVSVRLWVAIAFAILLGVILDRVFSMWWRRRKQRRGR
jgi:uncharacterized integral membrane protein